MELVSQITTRIPKLEKSWCGCSLHTGTKIIGIFSVLAKSLIVILLSIECSVYSASSSSNDVLNESTFTILIAVIIISFFDLMVSVLLVMAAYTERPSLAKPWLVVIMFSLAIEVIVFVSALAVGDLRIAIITPIRIGFGLYFWLVVFNYCQESREEPLLGANYDTGRVEEGPPLGRYQT